MPGCGASACAQHQRRDMPAPHPGAVAPELIAQHPRAHEGVGVLQMHQGQFGFADGARQVVHRAPADAQQVRAALDGEVVASVDHRFPSSKPALVSARSKKSFSSVSWTILACSGSRSTGSAAAEPPPNASAACSS